MRAQSIRSSLAIEALTAGLAYGAGLWWGGVCLLASFRPNNLGAPYWHELPRLRSDTSGVLAFFVFGLCLFVSESLRLIRRRRSAARGQGRFIPADGTGTLILLALSETVLVLGTGLVVYLSVNAVTHPATLELQATHVLSWPTEGTLRIVALCLSVASAAALRHLRAGRSAGPYEDRPQGPGALEVLPSGGAGRK